MSKPIIWIHGDCLNPHHPGLKTYPEAPAIWVWDDALLAEWQISLKRITFIYECLLELPAVIRRGDVAKELVAFAEESDADLVITSESPSPRFHYICEQIKRNLTLEVLPVDRFFEYNGYIDLKRFSRYWKIAERYFI
ncbi:MAG TPA: hypothetical protein V6D28_07660 [Leptolyngbyaceae cyanobacterium]